MASTTTDHNKNRNHQLYLDHVLSTQSELGPKIPDGGYGWIIFAASAFFQIVIPSLPVGYGIIILFAQLESGISTNPKLWDMKTVYTPLFFISIFTITEPLCRKIVLDSTWPRLVSVAANCLTSAGLLILWIAINNRKTAILYIAAGSISGFGACLLLTQVDVLISQYFYVKLKTIRTLLTAFSGVGFVITPIILGHYILKIGILQCVSWYQALILQGVLIGIAFRKPEYLKFHRNRYNLLKGIADEEEDIFTKGITELQSPKIVQPNNLKTASATLDNTQLQSLQQELKNAGWDNTTSNEQNKLNNAFAVQFDNAVTKLNHRDSCDVDTPAPLFTDFVINNNVSYSYESSPTESDNPVVFTPIENPSAKRRWTIDLCCFKELTFYKTLIFVITLTYSVFLFWSLFPLYLYLKIDNLQVHHAVIVVGCVSMGGLVLSTIGAGITMNINVRSLIVSIFGWASIIGCLIFSDSRTEASIVFAAILINLNINSLQTMVAPLMKFNFRGESSSGHAFICTLTGVSLILLTAIDISFKNCFRLLAVLQFLTESLYLISIMYKKIKMSVSRR